MVTHPFVRAHCLNANIAEGDYRPDVDGLRAIAVLSVIGFHSFPTVISGGFAGVDIFFVISGYLISKHILSELYAGTFATIAFYVRRIKRIFPALLLILILSTVVGWILLTPDEYKVLGRHVGGGAGFVANLVYWQEAGYFDRDAASKPLLHLWSLGVEEQFYIVWPLFLLFLSRRGRHLGRWIAGVVAVSLVASVLWVHVSETADFYSPFTRFWELALGALVAYGVVHRVGVGLPARNLLSWLGLLLVLGSTLFLNRQLPFPGWWAVLPTLGAGCLILAGQEGWCNRHWLANRWLVGIGLISYPLYLWHWPLLSFARIMDAATPPLGIRLGLFATSVILAWLTYHLLERPIRRQSGERARRIAWGLLVLMALMLAVGVTIKKLDGLKFRHLGQLNGNVDTLVVGKDREQLARQCGIPNPKHGTWPFWQKDLFNFCLSDGRETPRSAVLGDSKAEALFYGMVRESRPGNRWLLVGSVRPPRFENAPEEDKSRRAYDGIVANPSIRWVVLVNAMRSLFPVNRETGWIAGDTAPIAEQYRVAFNRVIRGMEGVGKRVVFVIDNPTLPDPRSCIGGGMTSSPLLNHIFWRKLNERCTLRYSDHRRGTEVYRHWVDRLVADNPGLMVYDPTPLLCDVERDMCSITRNGQFLYSYTDHMSDYANSRVARELLGRLEEGGKAGGSE
ncbi:MAG: acyltransferase [Magnetococcales bacterium]|nr:acyltransferase [Magnetococcales bacterium]